MNPPETHGQRLGDLLQQHTRLGALQRLVLDLTSTLELNDVLQRVVAMAQNLSASAHAHIFLYDPARDELNLAASQWSSEQRVVRLQPRRAGTTFAVARSGVSQFIENTITHPAYANTDANARPGALACLPLIKGEQILGTLNLGYWEPHAFDPPTRDFLNLMARHAAIAIDHARLLTDTRRHADELARRVQELVIVNELSRGVNSLDVDGVLQYGLELIARNFQATYCALGLYDPATDVITVRAVEPAHDPSIGMSFNVSENPLMLQALRRNQPFTWRDDPAIFGSTALVAYLRARGIRELYLSPMINRDVIAGLVAVAPGARALTDDQIALLQTIGNQILVALENAHLQNIAIEKAKLEHEFHLARDLQTSLIPRALPEIAGWDIAALWRPAQIVSGDFYDLIQCETPSVVIGDVSGKGVPAALFMALVRGTLRSLIAFTPTPADCITQANQLICQDTENGMFATLCYAQIGAAGDLVYVNAGHNPPLWYHYARAELRELTRTGIALGVECARQFDQRAIQLAAGDFVVLYTDGVTDAIDAQECEFGEERLRDVVLAHRDASAAEMITALDDALCEFAGEFAFDDVTAVVLKRK